MLLFSYFSDLSPPLTFNFAELVIQFSPSATITSSDLIFATSIISESFKFSGSVISTLFILRGLIRYTSLENIDVSKYFDIFSNFYMLVSEDSLF